MFNSARLKLTFWYLLIIMLVSSMFSVVIYRLIGNEIERFATVQRFRVDRMAPFDPDLVLEAKHRIGIVLLYVNGVIFVVSASLGFFLAGQTLQPIQEMLEEQNRFISDASHELRTPLTSLKAAFEVHLRDKKHSLTQADTLINESLADVNKLQSLSESLLQLVQYESTGKEIIFAKISVKKIIDQAIHVVKPLASLKKIKINTKTTDVYVMGNLQSLTDALVIILDNAVKYSQSNKSIDVSAKKTDGHVIIEVKDYGTGIKADALPHVFDRFYRGDSSRSEHGYGLGLSIAKKIVKLHHGDITVHSKIDHGTTLQLKFSNA